jgi:hypothetical protein
MSYVLQVRNSMCILFADDLKVYRSNRYSAWRGLGVGLAAKFPRHKTSDLVRTISQGLGGVCLKT